MSYLLGVTIGPIQTNIQKSKKLRDLYNSSKIVSDLMKEIIQYLKEKDEKIKAIYPSIKDINAPKVDITNYLICEISDISCLECMKENIFKKFKNELGESVLEEIYFMFWAVEPLEEYTKTYKKLTKKLRGIKNTYEFKNYKDIKFGKKCSLCGERVREHGSELCKVCNYKREYNKNQNYESVYDISIDIWKENNEKELKNSNEKLEHLFKNTARYYSLDTVSNFINLLGNADINKAKEIRKEKEINKDLHNKQMEDSALIKNLKNIKRGLEGIYLRDKNAVLKPHYKYCFVQVDVDNLGKWISGKYNYEDDDLKENQIQISKALCNFAYELKEGFKNSKTKVIYAGGDDFLAVLPVECLLDTLKTIDQIFKREVKDNIDSSLNYSEKITYSASVTIANCKDEMSLALRKNREVLEKVKNRYSDKNGICINYIINTSKIINMFLSKDYFNQYIDNLYYFKKVKKYMSFSYINAIEKEFNKVKFEDLEIDDFESIDEMITIEFKRYLNKNKDTFSEDKKGEFEEYFNMHTRLFQNIINDNIMDEKFDFINFVNSFKIYEKLTHFEFQKEAE